MTRSEIVKKLDEAVAISTQLNVGILGFNIEIYRIESYRIKTNNRTTVHKYEEFTVSGSGYPIFKNKEEVVDFLLESQIADRIDEALR